PHGHDRLLGDTGVLVRALELGERVDVRADFARHLAFVRPGAVHANDDAFAVDRVHDTRAAADNNRARVTSGNAFHAGADVGRFGAQQRHSLALHVRTHQRAVGVVVFEERNQRGSDRDKLFRADVHVLDLFALREREVTGLPGVDEAFDD